MVCPTLHLGISKVKHIFFLGQNLKFQPPKSSDLKNPSKFFFQISVQSATSDLKT